MLRWLIAGLLVANVLGFVTLSGAFGPAPAAGPREPFRRSSQVRPDALRAQPLDPAQPQPQPQPVIGGPGQDSGMAAYALSP
ncbi:hypothetical protein IHE33_11105 [Mycetohabitans endofungorum]|uniref:hypothetical protein n=1 Tax=Mycetohabitans endofungorum TaxID=417203 RepID=UPI0030CD6197